MLNFDYITLDLLLKEAREFFEGARLQKIQQPTRQELVFTMRNLGETRKFYININPRFFHACFMSKENEAKRFIEVPKSTNTKNAKGTQKARYIYPPPMFCMQLRKYLEGSKIAKIEQPEAERILEFYFSTYDETGEKIFLCLAIELMGKHSNVVLYNYDTNVIIGCAHNVGSDKSREREVIGGLPYVYPLKAGKRSFVGFSSLLKPTDSVNDNIDNYFANFQLEEKTKSLQSKLLTQTKTKLKKAKTALEKVKNQGTSEEKAQNYRKYGDLIMSNLFNNKDFLQSIEIFDYETNENVKIELDETKTLKENANRFYKLYNKAKTANLKSQEMIENFEIEKNYLEQILYSIESAQDINDLFEIEEELNITNNQKIRHAELDSASFQRSKSDRSRNKFGMTVNVLKQNISDFTIYIGKNNKQNDFIASKLARPDDLWFHAHNCAGSHVLLRVDAGQKVTDEIIFECAKLAKEHSSAKLSKIGVIYTQAKNLKKPSGAALGYVIYKNEKEIIID